ncbi:hypothetical protein FRC14_001782 [Serendipita sp. 396]|nr:hypothetical protein FRC14_001782 [Serendipita sp. 396]KAG8773772.1 hypothetical protein FRC15_001818 [Serendipita sp. 397]KAG8825410.1 hypothetical protein FRC19_011466 [Serendipita sp. 401]KAG8853604.1 hypothetical protein FRB91_004671 [Serendipita sp. 411]KAG9054444.1 hypothetical protein FS842_005102 [Serendipita sp. 407]
MMFKSFGVMAAFAGLSSVSALSVLTPSSQWWWQSQEQALFSWDCTDKTHPQFAVLATNTNVTLLSGGYVVLQGQQDNFVCNTIYVPDLIPGAGYKLALTNIVNYTDIYVYSEAFEVRPKGSPYPTIPTPSIGGATASATGSGSSQATGGSGQSGGASLNMGFSLGGALALAGALTVVLGA